MQYFDEEEEEGGGGGGGITTATITCREIEYLLFFVFVFVFTVEETRETMCQISRVFLTLQK